MGVICGWVVKHRAEIKSYLDEKTPAQAPDDTWWILVHCINQIMDITNICFKSLQGKDTLLSEQNERLSLGAQDLRALIAAATFSQDGVGFL